MKTLDCKIVLYIYTYSTKNASLISNHQKQNTNKLQDTQHKKKKNKENNKKKTNK